MEGMGSIRSCNSWWTPDQPVFAASEAWNLVSLVSESGREPVQLVSEAGQSFNQLLDPSNRLSLIQCAHLINAGFKAGLDNFAFLLGRRLHLSTYGVPGFAVMSSRTMSEADLIPENWIAWS